MTEYIKELILWKNWISYNNSSASVTHVLVQRYCAVVIMFSTLDFSEKGVIDDKYMQDRPIRIQYANIAMTSSFYIWFTFYIYSF